MNLKKTPQKIKTTQPKTVNFGLVAATVSEANENNLDICFKHTNKELYSAITNIDKETLLQYAIQLKYIIDSFYENKS